MPLSTEDKDPTLKYTEVMISDLQIVIALQSFVTVLPGGRSIAAFCAQWLMYVFIGFTVFFSLEKSREQKRGYYEAIVSALIAFGITYVVGHWFMRVRPFIAFPSLVIPFIDTPLTLYSMPSGHATFAFALAASLSYVQRKLTPFVFTIAFFIAIGRVAVGVHYLSDVIVGASIGMTTALVLHSVTQKYFHKHSHSFKK